MMKSLWELGEIQGQWERRADLLATARPDLVEYLADIIDCELRAAIEYRDILALRAALGTWLDNAHDRELEDRIAVEVGTAAPWDAPE